MAEPASTTARLAAARLEGEQKVGGRARYTSDIELPGQLYAGVLRSPHAHARVRRLDCGAASQLPGVRAVLTPADVRDISWYDEDLPLLSEHPRFAGDEIAAVAADSHEAVVDALRAIEADYEVLPAAVGIDGAGAAGAPKVYEEAADNRAGEPEIYRRGDVEAGFAAAEVTVEASFATPTALHNALEPHGCNAWWDGERLNLWVSTQGIFAVRDGVAAKLGLPQNRVRVQCRHMGGGFGAKQVAWKECVLAALLARRTGRPVKLMLDRVAENQAAGNRNATRQRVRLGADREGRLLAIDVLIDVERGACTVGGESSDVAGCYQSLYACDNVRTEQRNWYSHAGPAVAFRAPGFVEGTFALEQAMDELARRVNLDPFELRERNYCERDQKEDLPYSSPQALMRCFGAVKEAFGWTPMRPVGAGRRRRGRGMAASIWAAGGSMPPASAEVCMHGDGTATVFSGAQDIGTGSRTALAQIAAQELGLPLERLRVELGDTDGELRSPASAGSATLATVGPAVQAAAAEARRRLLAIAVDRLGDEAHNLRLQDGCLHYGYSSGGRLSVAELAAASATGTVRGFGTCPAKPAGVALRTFAAVCAEVEVDLDSGEILVLRLACAPDCGRILNRRLADSQVIGGVTQGLGFALSEERLVDPRSGVILNPNLEDYLMPTAADAPPILHAAVDLPDAAENELGVKGLGEPPMIAVAPAIANAVFDACGLRLRELPMNRRRMLEALDQSAAEGSRAGPAPAGGFGGQRLSGGGA